MKARIMGFFLCLIVGGLLFFVGMDQREAGTPIEAYQVYLNGEKIGLIASDKELLDLIDNKQAEIRKKYGVDKIYPPTGLDIKKIYTYNESIDKAKDVYKKISKSDPFTIEGYEAKIVYTKDKIINDQKIIKAGDPVYIYMMDKRFIKEALYKTAQAFIGAENLKNYEDNTQEEITETGSIITSVYFEETITVRKTLVSTNEHVFKDSDELSRYLLYGTLEEQATYTVRSGEDLTKIAENNNLNIEELMIANPQFKSSSVLLSEGEVVNVGLINPLVSVVYRKTVIDDITVAYKTEEKKDDTKYVTYKEVIQPGKDGLTRVTQDIKYINGEIAELAITNREVLEPAVNEVVVKGTMMYGGYHYYEYSSGNESFSWPTRTPYIITSWYGPRWGSMHAGIDISGTGHGSPIFAIRGGVVVETGFHYSMGNYIVINHGDNIFAQYMHLAKIYVSIGQTVSREQTIGAMGRTGIATGTHLHLGIWRGMPYYGGVSMNPCKSVFRC